MNVNVGGTTTIKGAVLANADYVDGKLVDKNNLKLNTTNLIAQNIYDKNNSNSYNVSLGVSKTEKQTQGKMELGLSDSSKEQINYATIGNGDIKTNSDITNLNRDVSKSQVVTKDKNSNLNIYLSNTSVEKALNPNETVAKWGQDFKDMGLNVRNEILGNLPSATKLDKDGNGNIFDKTIGKALDYNPYGIGIVPSVANGGGYITQIATQLSGDNRGIIQTTDKQNLLNMNISDKDIIQTEDGNYVTDPNKTVVILKDAQAIENEKKLSDYNNMKIYITQEDAKNISHMFTNGIMNESQEAFSNGNEQTGYANTILVNYNQTHGAIGDLMESLQDSVVVKGIAFTNYIGASSVNPYVSYLGTGSAKQTADSLIQLAQARDGKLVVGAHSQGTLLTYSAMQYIKEDLQNVLKDKKDTILKVGFYGSPVNSAYSSILVKDLYTGSQVEKEELKTISNYFRSSINPGDPVGSISILLGGNGAGINSSSKSEGESSYVWSRGIGSMFNGKSPDDLANSSPHSGYVCVIGCGDGMVTPQFGDYVKQDKTTESLNIFYDERNLDKGFANFNQGENNEK